jgi:hypothetical protein
MFKASLEKKIPFNREMACMTFCYNHVATGAGMLYVESIQFLPFSGAL